MGDHGVRCIEGTAQPPFACGHERLEGAAEHFRIDRRVGPPLLSLARREAMRAEQLAKERTHRIVGEAGGGITPLQFTLGEQPAVEERNGAKLSRDAGTVAEWRVQRAEEQREQHTTMKAPTRGHAGVEMPSQKGVIAVEPSLRLEKGQEEETRYAEEGELRAVRRVRVRDLERVRKGANALLQNAIEAA